MSTVKENDRVMIMDGNKTIFGVVKNIIQIPDEPVVIVRTDDGLTLKLREHAVTVVLPNEPEEKKDAIAITRAEFMSAVLKVTKPSHYMDKLDADTAMMLSLSGIAICKELEKELFGVDND